VGDQIVFAPDFSADVDAKHPEGDVTLRFEVEGEAFREALARYGNAAAALYQAPARW
jgi:hypothetical protein